MSPSGKPTATYGALAGLVAAALGVWASYRWQSPMLDGFASIKREKRPIWASLRLSVRLATL